MPETGKIGPKLLKLLEKPYPPDSRLDLEFGRYDLSIRTDDKGRPVQLFMGKRNAQGNIVGDRFARTMQEDSAGRIVKDHWERKGKAG